MQERGRNTEVQLQRFSFRAVTSVLLVPAVVTLVFGLVGRACVAGPLDHAQVSQKAKWLVHLDLDAGWGSQLGKRLREKWLSRPIAQRHLTYMKKTLGVDPTKDLHGITLYGTRLQRNAGVVIVHATVDTEKLLAHVEQEPEYRKSAYGEHVLHTWLKSKGGHSEHFVTACFYRPTLTVFGRDTGAVMAALDVLDGKSPGLTDSDSALAKAAPNGTIVQAGVIGLTEAEGLIKSPVLRQSQQLSVILGETEDSEIFARASLKSDSAQTATRIRDTVVGFRAFATLRHQNDEQIAALLEGLSVESAEQAVTVEWRATADLLFQVIEKVRAKRAYRHKRAH